MTNQVEFAGWGRRNGFVEVRTPPAGLATLQLVDRLLILDVVNRYGWAFDERDLDAFYPILASDAVLEGSVAGSKRVGPYVGRDAILAWLKNSIAGHSDQRRHILSNPIFVSQNDDTAEVNVYLSLTSTDNGQAKLMMTGFYAFTLHKNNGWAISRVFAGFDNGAKAQPASTPAEHRSGS